MYQEQKGEAELKYNNTMKMVPLIGKEKLEKMCRKISYK